MPTGAWQVAEWGRLGGSRERWGVQQTVRAQTPSWGRATIALQKQKLRFRFLCETYCYIKLVPNSNIFKHHRFKRRWPKGCQIATSRLRQVAWGKVATKPNSFDSSENRWLSPCLDDEQLWYMYAHHVWLFETPWTVQPTRLLCPWDFPGKNTGVGCHFLLQ